ncbi:hypothetical protein BCR34DRAFT_575977 [Clohesyomyces aquaticus]|uniref:Uncharacterized protein n=1 Tax=Clohesyomyces aquaticus TaxID=1231657 RepID=A0A1Y1YR00_9PLEO|nr:hypothetical protein BCR34DRAFT_575977 [Clohesyomyces aquaticus]
MIHQSLSANLVLRFQALSALLQAELIRVEGHIPSYRIPTFDNNACGSFDIYHLSPPFPARIHVECILLGKFDEHSSLPHIHFTSAREGSAPNLRKRNIESPPDPENLQDWAVLVVRYKEEDSNQSSVCERIGTLTIHAHCFLARYPIFKGS